MRKGFTIIECLISVILLAITMVGSMAFYFYSTGHLAGATHKRIAAELANAKMEELKNTDYDDITNDTQNITISATPGIPMSGINGTENVTVNPGGGHFGGPEYKEVHVEIAWSEPTKSGLQQKVTLSTNIAPR